MGTWPQRTMGNGLSPMGVNLVPEGSGALWASALAPPGSSGNPGDPREAPGEPLGSPLELQEALRRLQKSSQNRRFSGSGAKFVKM